MLSEARTVRALALDLVEDVKRGDPSLDAAYKTAQERKPVGGPRKILG